MTLVPLFHITEFSAGDQEKFESYLMLLKRHGPGIRSTISFCQGENFNPILPLSFLDGVLVEWQ